MSSEEEATAANVLSQMSQIQQISCETIEATVINVGHHCDVETTASQVLEIQVEGPPEEASEVLQQVQVAVVQQNLQQPTALVESNGQIRAQLGTSEVAILPVPVDSSPAAVPTRIAPTGGRIYPCEYCGKEFNKSYNLKTHTRVHTGRIYPCEYCGKEFNKSYNLKTHIRVHTGERPYQCEECGHGFANLGDLKRHARTHTGEKPFKCEYCGKVFSDFGSHKRHLRLHTGFKPFRCEHCDREFTRLDSYKNHIRLHTGDRPYKCDTCGKEFNYLTTYKRHLNIHKGEKPFACEHCDKKFTRLNYLKNHRNTHAKHSSQECQTDFNDPTARPNMDVDDQEDLGPMEEDTAAQSIQNEDEPLHEGEADKGVAEEGLGTEAISVKDEEAHDATKSSESKTPDAALLQQVTQVLGEIVPHSLSAELTEGAGGPQIVVQGADQAGGEFKITLAQQLLLAQHLLNQVQIQRLGQGGAASTDGEHGDTEQPQITTVSIPDISPELAEQIVNQAAAQQAASEHASGTAESILLQSPSGVLRMPDTTSSQRGQAGMILGTEVMVEGQDSEMVTEHVLQESTAVPVTSDDGVSMVGDSAVYVAIDPNQPDVQHLLGQIQAIAASHARQDEEEEGEEQSLENS